MQRFIDAYRDAEPDDLPWFRAEPDPDLVVLLAELLPEPGAEVLDLGAGPAVHTIHLAAAGHRVTAVDAVPEARDMALRLAAAAGVALDYQVADVLGYTPQPDHDLVFDRGFLHTLDRGDWRRWRDVVQAALRPGGVVVMKCFDVRPVRENFGPPGLTARDVLAALGDPVPGGLALDRLQRVERGFDEGRPHASWTAVARRLAG